MARRELFGSMAALVFLMNFGRVVYAPLLETFRVVFDASPATLGVIASLAWLGSALPRIPTGYLLTRVSRGRVVVGTGLVLTAASTFMAFANSVPTAMVGAFLVGIASGAYFIAANPLISELFPDGVGRALGIHGMASQLAAAATGVIVTGALLVGTWRTVFQGLAVIAALGTATFVLAARRTTVPAAGSADRDLVGAIRHQYPIILAGVAVLGFAGLVWNGLFNFYVSYLVGAKNVSPSAARTLLTVVFAAGVPAFYVSGRLADRLSVVDYLFGLLGAFVALVLLLTATYGFGPILLVSALLGYTVHGLFPAVDTYLLGSLPDRHRASAYAAYSGSMMIVQAAGSSIVGLLTDLGYGYDLVFRSLAGALAVAVLAMAVVHSRGRFPTTARA